MMDVIHSFSSSEWNEKFNSTEQLEAMHKLESGKILFFPKLAFQLSPEEMQFLTPSLSDPHAKNISYAADHHKLWGVQRLTDLERVQLQNMLDRFLRHATALIHALLPNYARQLIIARTSFRPVEICNRKTSYRKDDKRLHIDAFPSAPNQGKRILRVFCNVNPHDQDRVWRVGESFEKVATQFLPRIAKPFPGVRRSLRLLRITKSFRTLYDHYMLQMHDRMKADDHYQQHAEQCEIPFPTRSTWIVQTDQVSHAAMRGQYVLEQTFYLPIEAMQDEYQSPLRVLEKILNKTLI